MSLIPPEPARAILLATLHDLQVPHFLAPLISSAAENAQKGLRIVLVSFLFNEGPLVPNSHEGSSTGVSHTEKWSEVQRILTFVYVRAAKISQAMGKVLMEIDVLLKGSNEILPGDLGSGFDRLYCLQGDDVIPSVPDSVSALPVTRIERGPDASDPSSSPPPPQPGSPLPSLLPVAILGGTFDHLHVGHKILLSMGAWIASQKLIVGLTDDVLLTKKPYKSVLEPFQLRAEKVLKFLKLFKPALTYDLVPITDVYGPTRWDPNIQALVVSKETLSGANASLYHPLNYGRITS